MYKLFKIAKDNVKKQKGDMITFFILTFIAAFMIFDSASAILGMGNVLDECFESINGAHVMLYSGDTEAEKAAAEKAFTEDDRILEYEQSKLAFVVGKYKNKNDEEFMDYQFLVESFDEEKTLMNIKKPDINYKKNDILLPFNMHNSFAVGDVIQIKFDEDVYDFNVVGYIEDPYFCSTMNITMYSVCMSQEIIDELEEKYPNLAVPFIAHKGTVDKTALENHDFETKDIENSIGNTYKNEITKASKANPEANYSYYLLVNWQMMRGGSQFIPMVVIAVILIFAILILIIAIIIISFSVKNFIQKNMKNTGILEASGYTVKELRWSLTLQIMLIGLIGSIIGDVVGILTFESFGNIIASVLGLTWNQPVNYAVAIITVVSIVVLLGLVARLISRAYKKISVLDALRGGINTHNFKRNFFSFEKTPLPISVVMALKETFGGLGRNLLMVFIAAILSISVLIGFGLYENFGKDSKTIVEMFGFEISTVFVTDDDFNTDYEKVADDIENVDGVTNVLVLSGIEPEVIHGDNKSTIYTYVADDINKTQNTIVLEGRTPQKDNEIMLTSAAAEDLDAKIGDVVTIKYAEEEAEYIVVGINQRMERMGRTVLMTIDGAKRVVPGALAYQYYVQAEEGVTFEELTDKLDELEKTSDYNFSYIDEEKVMNSTIESVSTAMKLICLIISMITVAVVIFVESLVIRAKISREWRGMGISKALGQTSGNLISQIMLSNLPAIAVGTVLGAIVAPFAGSNVCKTAFSLFSIKNIPFSIPFYYLLITIIGIIVVAVLTSGTAGLKVRGLKPVEMIVEE